MSQRPVSLKARFRYINAFLVAQSAIIIGLGLYMTRVNHSGAEQIDRFQTSSVPSNNLLQSIREKTLLFEVSALQYIFAQTDEQKASKKKLSLDLKAEILSDIGALETALGGGAQASIENIRPAFGAYADIVAEIRALLGKDDFFAAVELWDKEAPRLNAQLRAALDEGSAEISRVYAQSVEHTIASFASLSRLTTLSAATSLLITLFVATFVAISSNKISRSLGRALSSLQASAQRLSSNAQSIVGNARRSSAANTEGAQLLRSISESTRNQADITQRTAANSRLVDEVSQENMKVVEGASSTVQALAHSMQQIAASGEETQKIIKTIDEIAFQTNILALNAAVEAARAGEAGSGFAVVADEVRSLAMRCAAAARNSSQLIETSASNISNGSEMVSRTTQAFASIEEKMKQVRGYISQIADQTDKQAACFQEISASIAEVDAQTSEITSFAEKTSQSSEDLSHLSEELNLVVEELMYVSGSRAKSPAPPDSGSLDGLFATETARAPSSSETAAQRPAPSAATSKQEEDLVLWN